MKFWVTKRGSTMLPALIISIFKKFLTKDNY
jgi:hypothetical protein